MRGDMSNEQLLDTIRALQEEQSRDRVELQLLKLRVANLEIILKRFVKGDDDNDV